MSPSHDIAVDVFIRDCFTKTALPTREIHLLPGDTLILATDGLLSLNEKEVSSSISSSIANNHDPAKSLIFEIQEKKLDQQDNVTVTVINFS